VRAPFSEVRFLLLDSAIICLPVCFCVCVYFAYFYSNGGHNEFTFSFCETVFMVHNKKCNLKCCDPG